MKKTLTLLLLLGGLFLLSSCGSLLSTSTLPYASIGDRCSINVEVFQTLSDHEALAIDSKDFFVIKLISTEETYYDKKRIHGTFVFVDTYTYEAKDERIKTVPVYQRVSELKKQ